VSRDRQPEGRRRQDHDDQTVGLALADLGRAVLLVDLDPQAASRSPSASSRSVHATCTTCLLERVKAGDAIIDAGRYNSFPPTSISRDPRLHL